MRSLARVVASATVALLVPPTLHAAPRTVDLARPFTPEGSVRIENVAGSVKVKGWDREELRVIGSLGEGVEDVAFSAGGRRARIEVRLKKGSRARGGDAHLEVFVPRGASLHVETVSADINVDSLGGALEAETVSGAIRVAGASTSLSGESVSGPISLEDVSGEVKAESVSGSLTVSGKGILRASCETVSGSIHFSGPLSREGKYSFGSFSGTIELRLPSHTDANVAASTFSGRIVNELSEGRIEGEESSFTLGEGGAELRIETFSGDAWIRPLAP